jgi:hydroxymethylbilane synthase
MGTVIRIGTRESQLAIWQATVVKDLLAANGFAAELIPIKSEGDIDLQTPLYEMGVQGIFTRSLDLALLHKKIDLAVHSMKDVPTQLPNGIGQAAILKRGPVRDLLVYKGDWIDISNELGFANGKWSNSPIHHPPFTIHNSKFTIATSSIRRKAQWLNRYPDHQIENLRGNVNTRLRKLQSENWNGAIFAQAGLERIQLRPEQSIELDWMLPAPAQGAIMVVAREDDQHSIAACQHFNDKATALCTKLERDFLRTLLGGCSTPISAFVEIDNNQVNFRGNILSVDGKDKVEIELRQDIDGSEELGIKAAAKILEKGGQAIADSIRHATK